MVRVEPDHVDEAECLVVMRDRQHVEDGLVEHCGREQARDG